MELKVGISAADCTESSMKHSTIFFNSRFNFLREVNGIRPSCTHCLLGLASAGKSTLMKAIVADTIKEKCKVLVWLSEEEVAPYSKGIIEAYVGAGLQDNKNKIFWFEESLHENEIDENSKTWTQAVNYIIDKIVLSGCNVVFFDNITTSDLYGKFSPQNQADIIKRIRSFCSRSNVAFFFLAHTSKNVNSSIPRLLTSEDVQGSSGVSKNTELFFILQTFDIGNRRFSFINITKSRPIEGGIKNRYFMLNFSGKSYSNDKTVEFEEINEAYKTRNKLSDAPKKAQYDNSRRFQ